MRTSLERVTVLETGRSCAPARSPIAIRTEPQVSSRGASFILSPGLSSRGCTGSLVRTAAAGDCVDRLHQKLDVL